MAETVVQEAAATAPVKTSKKKATTPKVKSIGASKSAATHPPTAQMVNNAIKNLKERGGSSLQAIKKYIAGTYKVDAEKLSPFIKKYLKSAVDGGKLIRTKGKGASGSFKLPTPETKKAEKKPKVAKTKKPKAAVAPKAKKPKAEKPKSDKSAASPKKPKVTKPKVKSEKPKAATKEKSPSKVKKTTKTPAAKKPKSPKLKKAASKASKPKTTKATAKK